MPDRRGVGKAGNFAFENAARVGNAAIGEKTRMSVPFPGTFRWGLLRDSDPFKGFGSGAVQPNYAVAFELTAP